MRRVQHSYCLWSDIVVATASRCVAHAQNAGHVRQLPELGISSTSSQFFWELDRHHIPIYRLRATT